MGAEQLSLHVAQAALDGSAMSFKFGSRPELITIITELHKGSSRVAGSPHAATDMTEDQARLYGERFVDKWGDADGSRLVTGARGWELFRVQPDGSFGAGLCARPSWGKATAAAVGVPPEGIFPADAERDEFGVLVLSAPPMSKHQRKEHVRAADRAYQQAETALVAAAAEAEGDARAAVAELGRVCAQRSELREAVYAPKLATAVADVLSADPTLEGAITAYVQTHGAVMMLKLRSEASKVGHGDAAAKSEAAQELMRLLPTVTASGAVIMVGQANAPKLCFSSGTQKRYRCKWCNLPYESSDAVRRHGGQHHAVHFQPKKRYNPSYYCVEETY